MADIAPRSSEKEDHLKCETFYWNPAGTQSRPAEPGQQPEVSHGLGHSAPGGLKTAAACAGVGSRVSADRDQKVRHAARLDGPGTPAGQTWGNP